MIPLETDYERLKLAKAYIRSTSECLGAVHHLELELAEVPPTETTKRAVLAASLRVLEAKVNTYLGLIQHNLIPGRFNLTPLETPHGE